MVDFFMVATKSPKNGIIEIYPKFLAKRSSDLMIRGGDFYSCWVEEKQQWTTDQFEAIELIDRELDRYYAEHKNSYAEGTSVRVLHLWDADTGMIDKWHKFCQRQQGRDHYTILDETLVFSNTPVTKELYSSKKLPYALEPGSFDCFDRLLSTLYSESERHKIEWSIGAIVTGKSKEIQKFAVLYGAPGTGKGTVINILSELFQGYCCSFEASALASNNNSFALETFRNNPLVAIQQDGDLSRIENNTRINSLVSHEEIVVNEKFKSAYSAKFKCFLYLGTNRPVKITDAKSGLLRRLIDISPTGNKIPKQEYDKLMRGIKFELGGIAWHCKEVFEANPGYYDSYVPKNMLSATNDFYNYILDSYDDFDADDGTTLANAWDKYKKYCDYAKVPYPMTKRVFQEELKTYFMEFKERHTLTNGERFRSYYLGFKRDIFSEDIQVKEIFTDTSWLELKNWKFSNLDILLEDGKAQYANAAETPYKAWDKVTTVLKDIDTSKLHYVKPTDTRHIVIDFDLKDENGNKSLPMNLKAASEFPKTYAEVSKGGQGLHLHYIWTGGDVSKLSFLYSEGVEIKLCTGGSSIRRKLTLCNKEKVATLSSGLPIRKEKPVIDNDILYNEKALRTIVKNCIEKNYTAGTKPNVEFMVQILNDQYEKGAKYDLSDLDSAIWQFASNSTHHADYCINLLKDIHLKGKDDLQGNYVSDDGKITFYDVEVYPNLFIICWKFMGDANVVTMINPSQEEVHTFMRHKLVGFNCRKYDNHILWARSLGYSLEGLYDLSQAIINGDRTAFFGEAYDISYTDVLDFSSEKKSLKKFEIELGIHHQEMGLPWDQPVPEELWDQVAEYCKNDVIATEEVFKAREGDWIARQILADIAGGKPNDTTNSLTTKIIFGKNRKPQSEFNYRNMGDISQIHHQSKVAPGEYNVFDAKGRPIFPGYFHGLCYLVEDENGKRIYPSDLAPQEVIDGYSKKLTDGPKITRKIASVYRGEEVGEGGYVHSEPGMYQNIALDDITSQHPTSIEAEDLFGQYTKRFSELKSARIAIKHKDYETARTMLDGKLAGYLTDKKSAKMLTQALKIAINSVYGLTSAKFDNPFRDPRNTDNIVAKRGALFMINLKHAVQERGYTVAHIKTDSIKVVNADKEILQFISEFGKEYGYSFEHEATYERMCLVNKAVYIAKYERPEVCEKLYGYIPEENSENGGEWTATGPQFQVPYVFKTLFSHESINLSDYAETKEVSGGASMCLDISEELPDVTEFELLKVARANLDQGSKLTKKQQCLIDIHSSLSDKDVDEKIASGHAYKFVGKVGSFCPMEPGCGAGYLLRQAKDSDKKTAVTGTTGYLWMETEEVIKNGLQEKVDKKYHDNLITEAIQTIGNFGDAEWFIGGN